MADREEMIEHLKEIAEYFRGCRNNASFASKAENHFWELQNAASEAAELLKAQEPGWISVKDRLPDMLEPFWAACKSLTDYRDNWTIEGIYKGTTFGGPWGVPIVEMGKAEVYAWKPKEIPEPPKEG